MTDFTRFQPLLSTLPIGMIAGLSALNVMPLTMTLGTVFALTAGAALHLTANNMDRAAASEVQHEGEKTLLDYQNWALAHYQLFQGVRWFERSDLADMCLAEAHEALEWAESYRTDSTEDSRIAMEIASYANAVFEEGTTRQLKNKEEYVLNLQSLLLGGMGSPPPPAAESMLRAA